jgi:hypothetical protein
MYRDTVAVGALRRFHWHYKNASGITMVLKAIEQPQSTALIGATWKAIPPRRIITRCNAISVNGLRSKQNVLHQYTKSLTGC